METPNHLVFQPHGPKQESALFFETPIGLLACGIQFGKTKVGSVWMKMKNHTFTDPSDNFLIVAPTYKILTQSTLPPYLAAMSKHGDFSKADMIFKIHGGGTVYMRSGTDPDSVVGITNIRAVWGDECGLFTLYFSENLMARAAFRGAQMLLTTSPYALNWIFKDIIRPKMRNPEARPDVTLIQAASWENPYFPKDVIERNRKNMDPRRFNILFGGKWDKVEGLVYDCFDEQENQVPLFPIPTDARHFAGVDWGYTDPFVLLIHAVLPNGKRFQVSETYKTGLTIQDIVTICRQKKDVFRIEQFYCDPSQPGYIKELCRNGIPACAAVNDIRPGVDLVYELIKTRQLKFITGSSPHTIDEIETYHYPEPEDLKPDQDSKEQNPVGQGDHAMDAMRYVSVMTKSVAGMRKQPKTPEEQLKPTDPYARMKLIRKAKRYGNGTESWD